MSPYAAEGGGFYIWCMGSGSPYVTAPRMIAMAESEFVMNNERMREERRFPVDRTVDAAGIMVMAAHIKIERIGPLAPRVYFYDDTGGQSGKVHIGYIGRHLTNTRT